MPTVLVEYRQHLVERDFTTSAWPAAKLLVGGIGDDSVEPGTEGRLTSEGVDFPDHGPERVLHDFLGVLRASHDVVRQAVRAIAIRGDEKLRRGRFASPQRLYELMVTIDLRHDSRPMIENLCNAHL